MTPEQKQAALEARAKGISDANIGALMIPPISRQAVQQALGPRFTPAIRHEKPHAKSPPRPTDEEFAASLRAWRLARKLSQKQAAALLRVSEVSIWTWENGDGGCALPGTLLLTLELLDFIDSVY